CYVRAQQFSTQSPKEKSSELNCFNHVLILFIHNLLQDNHRFRFNFNQTAVKSPVYPNEADMTNGYLETISLVERLHRHFLEVVKLELDGLGIHDINNVQGMMLFNIGDAEMTVGELTLRGCYLGSNVSYNVKKMVENGYLVQ